MPDFAQIARRLTSDVSRALKMAAPLPSAREPEPEESVACDYARAYFDEDCDAFYGIVHRQAFETQLRAHFKRDGLSDTEYDPGWYALRNTVYAAGSRILAVKHSTINSRESFITSTSWKYFLNALSVYTDLSYFRTSLSAVQALAMMVGRHHFPVPGLSSKG